MADPKSILSKLSQDTAQTEMENKGILRHAKETPKVFKKAVKDNAFELARKAAPSKGKEILKSLEP